MKNKFLILFDIDGTILLSKNNWNLHNKNLVENTHIINQLAINKLQEKGHYLVPNSGRSFYSLKRIYKILNLNSYAIASSGAHIFHLKDKTFKKNLMPIDKNISLSIAMDRKILPYLSQAFFDGEKYCYSFSKEKNYLTQQIKRNRNVKKISKKLKCPHDSLNIILDFNLEKEHLDILIKYINIEYRDYVVATHYQGNSRNISAIEINSKRRDKGDAAIELANMLNIPMKNVIVFGDNENDMPLIKKVKNLGGTAIVLKNGITKLKKEASIVLDRTNDQGAVGHYLNEKFNLKL